MLGGRFVIMNLFLLTILCYHFASKINNTKLRFIFSYLSTSIITLQLISLYAVKEFIGYKFYVHFSLNDFFSMIKFFTPQIIFFVMISIIIFILFFLAPISLQSIINTYKNKNKKQKSDYSTITILKYFFLFFSIFIMTGSSNYEKKGLINKSYNFIKYLYISRDSKTFNESLTALGMNDYKNHNELRVSNGKKNIIVISLESFEKAYLHNKLSHLTPNLSNLKNNWQYIDIEQNDGSDWTNGALYTLITGLPAYFGTHHNSIFTGSYFSQIVGVSHILKKAEYDIIYLCGDADFSGTKDMLFALQFDKVIDYKTIGSTRDKDVFDRAKIEIQNHLSRNKKFAIFLSTLDTHFPDGFFDKRMEQFVGKQNTNLEFMVSAVDYMIGDFISFLENYGVLDSTNIFILPDHLLMTNPDIFKDTGDRGLFILTNSYLSNKVQSNNGKTYQIDLPGILLDGAEIKHNARFFTEYINGNKNNFINDNKEQITSLNISGFRNLNSLTISKNYQDYIKDTTRFIAHAGGIIDSYVYTNSLEALDYNYSKGFRFFELDILKTRDDIYVAANDWNLWSIMTNYTGNLPPSHKEFLDHKIYRKYSSMDIGIINDWFNKHNDAVLITDKINEPLSFSRNFVDKDRLMMELFDLDTIKIAKSHNINVILSQNVLARIKLDKIKTLKGLGVNHVTLSRFDLTNNKKLLKDLKENGIKAYICDVNDLLNIKIHGGYGGVELGLENFVVKYEMDKFFGIYADDWPF